MLAAGLWSLVLTVPNIYSLFRTNSSVHTTRDKNPEIYRNLKPTLTPPKKQAYRTTEVSILKVCAVACANTLEGALLD